MNTPFPAKIQAAILFIGGLTMTLSSCTSYEDNPVAVSTTDPLPFPMDANKDRSIHPGDDFYQYCNGTWLMNTPIPEFGAIGGALYGGDAVMKQRVEELKQEVPYLSRFFTMMDRMYDNPDASTAYIKAQTDAIPKPATQEEAFRQLGRMYADGMDCLFETMSQVEDGVQKIMIMPSDVLSLVTSGKTQDRDAGLKIMSWIIEGMGITERCISNYTNSADLISLLRDMTPDDIYAAMCQTWQQQGIYASEAALAQYNAGKTVPLTAQGVKDLARSSLNYPLSYYIAQKYVPDEKRMRYQKLGVTIKKAFRKRLQEADWISEATRSHAIEKIDAMKLYLGAPDTWYTEYIPEIDDCTTFVEMIHRLNKSKRQLQARLLGGTDHFTSMLLGTVFGLTDQPMYQDLSWNNGKYQADCNAIFFYPALLMPPSLSEDVSMARQYALMATIGHEITHGFDSDGAKYDKDGKANNWWTDADLKAFEERQQKLVDCYSGLESEPSQLPGAYCNGKITLAENIADLGGFLAARDAYIDYLQQNGYTGETYRQQLRKYYEGFADVWCVRYSQQKAEDAQKSDFHAMARCRVNGVVMNTDMFYDLYDVDETHRLYLAPEKRTYIW